MDCTPLRSFRHLIIALCTLALLWSGCDGDNGDEAAQPLEEETSAEAESDFERETAEQQDTVAERVQHYRRFSTFLMGMTITGVFSTLHEDEVTVFAPPDDAFDAYLDTEEHDEFFHEENHDTVRDYVQYHVVPGTVHAGDLTTGTMTTAAGMDVEIRVDGDDLYYDDIPIVITDHRAKNGVFHVLDDVAIPPEE